MARRPLHPRRASIYCIICAFSMVRRDGILLDEGAMLTCCDFCIFMQLLQKFPWRDDSKWARRLPSASASSLPRSSPSGPNVSHLRAQHYLPHLVQPVLIIHVLRYVHKSHMYVCTLCLSSCIRSCLGSGGITRQMPTAVYQFVCRCCNSMHFSV